MERPRKEEQCKQILFKCSIKHGVAPKLISERLLSKEDKEDMLTGQISFGTLDCAVGLWKEYGMCDYANGRMEPYKHYREYLNKRNG